MRHNLEILRIINKFLRLNKEFLLVAKLPALAARTFAKLSKERISRKISERMTERLSRLSSHYEWARKAHQQVDHELAKDLDDQLIEKVLACRKGCSACCHTQVSATLEEASLLAKRIEADQIEVNFELLKLQASYSPDNWLHLNYEKRKCIFVGSDGSCQVYEDRPSVCRSNYVLGTPDQCSTKDGIQRPLRMLKTPRADMAIVGQFKSSTRSGTLPALLYEVLLAKKNQ